jgi:hypothetical protein
VTTKAERQNAPNGGTQIRGTQIRGIDVLFLPPEMSFVMSHTFGCFTNPRACARLNEQ